jgi:lipid-A-disaccharide synthase-like uncharacterized protein
VRTNGNSPKKQIEMDNHHVMKHSFYFAAVLSGVVALIFFVHADEEISLIPSEFEKALNKAGKLDLYSLEPEA